VAGFTEEGTARNSPTHDWPDYKRPSPVALHFTPRTRLRASFTLEGTAIHSGTSFETHI
jgi:hypothetical protein